MTRGKLLLWSTAVGLCGATLLFAGVNKVHKSMLTADTPQWVRAVTSLGLQRIPAVAQSPRASSRLVYFEQDPATLQGFDDINITGNLQVEISSAPAYRVQFMPAVETGKLLVNQQGRVLRLSTTGMRSGDPGILRIQAPLLTRISATGIRQLKIRQLRSKKVLLLGCSIPETRLEENQVAQWDVVWCPYTTTTDTLQADAATHAAGKLRVSADSTYSRLNR